MSDSYGAIGGGGDNQAGDNTGTATDRPGATVGGGVGNNATGAYSTVPGGSDNVAAGSYAFAAGRQAKANHAGTFVWADSTAADFASTAINQFLIRAPGGVGIGTTSPLAELDVAANGSRVQIGHLGCGSPYVGIGFGNTAMSGCNNFSIMGNGTHTYVARPTGGALYFREGTAIQMAIEVGGQVGIGDTTPADKLQVNGDIRVGTGTTGCVKDADGTVISGTCSSDARLKKNIASFPRSLAQVAALRPVHFDWRADEFPEKEFGAERSFGLIAQEVEQVLPELVSEDEQGFKAVNYSQLPLYAIQAIGELKVENDALKARLAQLESLIEQRLGAQVSKVQ